MRRRIRPSRQFSRLQRGNLLLVVRSHGFRWVADSGILQGQTGCQIVCLSRYLAASRLVGGRWVQRQVGPSADHATGWPSIAARTSRARTTRGISWPTCRAHPRPAVGRHASHRDLLRFSIVPSKQATPPWLPHSHRELPTFLNRTGPGSWPSAATRPDPSFGLRASDFFRHSVIAHSSFDPPGLSQSANQPPVAESDFSWRWFSWI
jgi:hypothetical protein